MTIREGADRGATAVEYALGLALIALVLISSVGVIEDRGRDKLDSEDARIGVVSDGAAYQPPTGPGGPPPPPDPPPPGSALAPPTFGETQPATQGSPASKWVAYVTITVQDTGGVAVSGVSVSFRWSSGSSPNGSCTTNGVGQCLISQSLNDSSPTVTVTVEEGGMTKAGWTPPTLPVTSGPFSCGTAC